MSGATLLLLLEPLGAGVEQVTIIPAGPRDTFVRRVEAASSHVRRVHQSDQTPLRRVEVPTGTVRRV